MATAQRDNKNKLVDSRKDARPEDEIMPPPKNGGKLRKVWIFKKQVKHGHGNQRFVFEVGAECPEELLKRMQDNGAVEEKTLGSD